MHERSCPPNRIGETYPAKSVRTLEDGRFEVDFGTCLSGWVDIRLGQLVVGQTVTLRFFDLPADNDRKKDHSYSQRSVYHAAGDGDDRFCSKFNYAGFRYITIDGTATPPALGDMKAHLIETAMDRVGHFRCSNDLFNRIHDLNVHTLRCLDLGGYSVDCPQRERMGYGADGQTALPAYLYLLDSASFLRKWLTDFCDVYEPETGRLSLCAPNIHKQHAPAWGGIVAPLAWSLYVYYGDRSALEEAFPVIRGHLRFLQAAVRDGVIRKELLGSAFHGDWVAPKRGMDSGNTPDQPMRELFNSCYLIYVWEIFAKVCGVLGETDAIAEAEANVRELREGVHREFYDESAGLYLLPEQAYQAMPLLSGAVPEALRPAMHKKLIGLIEAEDWHLDSGLPGTTLLLSLLMQLGEDQVISRIYNQETFPGWGYMLAEGATAIWEQWNGYWSQIHSCFACPAEWFYAGLAGIRPDESAPAFKVFALAPAFVDGVEFVEASYASVQGRIESNWRREDGGITWSVSVPTGAQARVRLPQSAVGLTVDGEALAGEVLAGEVTESVNARGDRLIHFVLDAGDYVLRW